jgi:hypothetical protein
MFTERINDHIDRARARLVEQDKESNNILKFQDALVVKWQELENLLWDIHAEKNILTAKYKSLDYLGDIVNEARNYREDEEYRKTIINKIIQNNSTGTPEEIITFISFNTKITQIHLIEIKQNAFLVEMKGDLTFDEIERIKNIIIIAKPLCVNFVGLTIIGTRDIIFGEMKDINYDYIIGNSGILLDTNNNDQETTLEVAIYKTIGTNLPGLSDWNSDTDFIDNGNLTDLME